MSNFSRNLMAISYHTKQFLPFCISSFLKLLEKPKHLKHCYCNKAVLGISQTCSHLLAFDRLQITIASPLSSKVQISPFKTCSSGIGKAKPPDGIWCDDALKGSLITSNSLLQMLNLTTYSIRLPAPTSICNLLNTLLSYVVNRIGKAILIIPNEHYH